MFIIPLKTDRPPRRRPVITESLIILNLLVYLTGLVAEYSGTFTLAEVVAWGRFDPQNFSAINLVTYQFLHDPDGLMHIAFNLLFLWVFGSAVEDRLGRIQYLSFYLVGGSVAAVCHMASSAAPVIGASGSVAAVSGAFLALFPRSKILTLFIIRLIHVPSLWFIGLYFTLDIIFWAMGRGGTAYMAHIGGSLYGFTTAFALLATGVVKREEFDVFFMFKQWRRRAAFRAATTRKPVGAWDAAQADTGKRLRRSGSNDDGPDEHEQQRMRLRSKVIRLLKAHELTQATAAFRELIADHPKSVLPEQAQLDVSNQLYAESDHEVAAQAYESFLQRYANSSHAGQVNLMLGMIYTRRLKEPERAVGFIEQARKLLRDQDEKALADQLHAEITG